jgi:alpha-tubulin suppressor-like RCC1 family protein
MRTEAQIQADIDAFNATKSAACLLLLAAETKAATTDRSVTVATVDDLPDLTLDTVDLGTVIFVESVGVPVVAQFGCWTGLDNRELRNDFSLPEIWAWGSNGNGRLGDDTTTNRSSPVSVVGGFADWCQVSGGEQHSLAVRTNGTAWAWGNNINGQLGDATATQRSSPVSVVGGFTDWCQVAGCGQHSLGVRINGTAWAWGANSNGRLGDNTTTNRSSPVSVVGGFTDWCQVSAGTAHSLGVRINGSAWSWGLGTVGRLGDGTTTSRPSPVSVVGGFTDWCQVSAGGFHSLGVRTSGSAWAWGCNGNGRLGDNTVTDRSSPVSVVGGFTDWCQVSGGGSHSLGVRINGTAWAWGDGGLGRLGDGTVTSRSSPVSVVGGFTDWCQVAASDTHSLGVRTNGTAWAWGSNSGGLLGDNTFTNRSSPVSVVGGFTDWCQVSSGNAHSLGVRLR